MKNSKKILITTEKREFFFLRTIDPELCGFCPSCRTDTRMVTVSDAVDASGASTLEILRAVEARELHSMETTNGHLLVCGVSLRKFRALK